MVKVVECQLDSALSQGADLDRRTVDTTDAVHVVPISATLKKIGAEPTQRIGSVDSEHCLFVLLSTHRSSGVVEGFCMLTRIV